MQENGFFLMINDDDEKYYYFAVKSKLDLYSSEWLRSKKEATTKGDHSFLPLKLGGFLVFEIFSYLSTYLRFPNCFISFTSEKHVFITIGFFLSGKHSHLL